MQTPNSRINASGSALRISPQSISSEVSSPEVASVEACRKNPPRVVRPLRTSPRYSDQTLSSSNLASRAPKERSPRVSDHKAPTSPLSEKMRSSKVSELESQISQLENDLKYVKDRLRSSETSEKQARKEAEESNQQVLVLSSKLQDFEKKLLELSASQNARAVERSEMPEERERMLRTELEALRKQQLHEPAALASALNEIERLRAQLKMVAQSEAAQTSHSESAWTKLKKLKEELAEMHLVVEDMKNQLNECKKSEAQAQELVDETLMQLVAAKKATEAHDAAASELEQSRARVKVLEELVTKLMSEAEKNKTGDSTEADFTSVKLEVEQLRSAQVAAEIRENQEKARRTEQTKHAHEMAEQIKYASGQREAELGEELRKFRHEIEELRSNMMDKEAELKSISEENSSLVMKLEKALLGYREHEAEKENSKRKAARVGEQLEAAQEANAEMESELRRLKVQSDQWRKAAEVAASMLSNEQGVERTRSMDSKYSPRMSLPYADEVDDDLLKKKNVNMLTRLGVLWKKPHK